MAIKEIIKKIMHGSLPIPFFVKPLIKLFYYIGVVVAEVLRRLYGAVVVGPVMKSIATVGSGLRIERIPYIRGPGRIRIGSNVYISGKIHIAFSRHTDKVPELTVGDNSFIGTACSFVMGDSISIGNDCLLGVGVSIRDNDGHPLDPVKRKADEPVDKKTVAAVFVKDGAWIAGNAVILKGVTIGENSVVGASAVVVKDVAPNTIVVGNPAKVIREL